MLRLFRYLKPYWFSVLILVAAIGGQVWGTLELPALMAKIVNEGIATQDTTLIWQTGFQMLGCAVLAAICSFVASFLSAKTGASAARDLRKDIFNQVLSFSISDIDKYSTASLITRTTNDVMQIQQTFTLCLSMLLRVPMMAIGAILQAIATAPDMTWIIVLAVVTLLATVSIVLAIVMPKFKIFQQLIDRLTLLTRENLTGLRVIRAFNNQALEREKFTQANTEITDVNIFINNWMSLESPLMTFIFNGTMLLCIWIGISLMTTDISYLGNMMAFMQYAIQVIIPFLFLLVLFVILPRANVSATRINEVLRTKPKVHWLTKTKGEPSQEPSVEFKNVSFAYPGAEAEILHNVSFHATVGKTIAFIGSTGSGKSTLINLIPRFYDATKGEIKINGLNVKDYAKDDLMQKLGLVPQKGILFAGSISSNIAFGNPKANIDKIKHAAKIAEAAEFIKKLPENFNYHIAQGGTNVSGGQRQRLSIARAVAKNPDVYIFDDSFSALDMKTDAKVRRNLKAITQNSVVLIVAQRISTIKDADTIIVLDKGNVKGSGTHFELLKTCPVYQEIAKSQLSEDEYAREMKTAEKGVR